VNLLGKTRAKAKSYLPVFVRRLLRSALHYSQRVGRWFFILWQVRGAKWQDQLVLVVSALAAPIIALHRPMTWQDPVLLCDAVVVVPDIGRFALRKFCDDLWHVFPRREQAIVNCLKANLKPGDVFIDAGSNIGIYTVMASKLVGSTGKVLAIEMMPDTAGRLEHHIHINSLVNVTLIRAALSAASGQTVEATVEKGKYGQASIIKNPDINSTSVVQVETITLDEVSRGFDRIRLMKMDLEGAELYALMGAAGLLRRLNCLIFENRGATQNKSNPAWELLQAAGFELSILDGNNCMASKVQTCTV